MNKKILALIFGAIAAVYLLILFTSQNHVDGDEGVVGIMAKHILSRGETPLFFYGQPYNGGGAIIAYLSAIPFAIFGVSSITFKMVGLALWFAALALVYLFCARFYSRGAAVASALLFATATPLIEWPFKMRSGYAGLPLISMGILYVFARLVRGADKQTQEPGAFSGEKIALLLFGFLCGLAYYNLELIVSLLLALFLASIYWNGIFWRKWKFMYVLAGVLLGLLPLIIYNLTHDFQNLKYILGRGVSDTGLGFFMMCRLLFLKFLPALFTGRNVDQYVTGLPVSVYAEYAIYLAVFVYAVYESVKRALEPSSGKRLDVRHMMIFFVFVQLFFTMNSRNIYMSPRFFIPLFPFISIILGVSFDSLWKSSGRLSKPAGALFFAALVALGTVNHLKYIGKSYVNDDVLYSNEKAVNVETDGRTARAIIDYLEQSGITFVRCSYFLQWRLVFESNEKIIASSNGFEPGVIRYPEYDEQVMRANKVAFIFHKGDIQIEKFRAEPYYHNYHSKDIYDYLVFIRK